MTKATVWADTVQIWSVDRSIPPAACHSHERQIRSIFYFIFFFFWREDKKIYFDFRQIEGDQNARKSHICAEYVVSFIQRDDTWFVVMLCWQQPLCKIGTAEKRTIQNLEL